MFRIMRRSTITIFYAFILFGVAWLFFSRLNDPTSWWQPIVQAYPAIGLVFKVIQGAGLLAFLMMLIGGIPVVLSALKQAVLARRRDILMLLSIALTMVFIFAVVCVLVLSGHWGFDPNGGILAVIALVTLIVVTVTLARAVLKGELSERVLRLALLPFSIVSAAMVVGLLATLTEMMLFAVYSPVPIKVGDIINWVVAELMIGISAGMALRAIWKAINAGRVRTA